VPRNAYHFRAGEAPNSGSAFLTHEKEEICSVKKHRIRNRRASTLRGVLEFLPSEGRE